MSGGEEHWFGDAEQVENPTVEGFTRAGRGVGERFGQQIARECTQITRPEAAKDHVLKLLRAAAAPMAEGIRHMEASGASREMTDGWVAGFDAGLAPYLDALAALHGRAAGAAQADAEQRGYQFGAAAADELATMLKSGTSAATLEAFWKGAQAGAARRTEVLIAQAVAENRPKG